jgi:hypothetical protein
MGRYSSQCYWKRFEHFLAEHPEGWFGFKAKELFLAGTITGEPSESLK